jgi:hypothetical protein
MRIVLSIIISFLMCPLKIQTGYGLGVLFAYCLVGLLPGRGNGERVRGSLTASLKLILNLSILASI